MSVIDYLKERWMTYAFIVFAFLFSAAVYVLDSSFSIRPSNAFYILTGWCISLVIFAAADYLTMKQRFRSFTEYCKLNGVAEYEGEFAYPIDKEYARLVHEISVDKEAFKAEVGTKAADEMEFVTKWLHDVKVPISAAKLILENNESVLPGSFYRDIYTELFSIEESIQRVFYELKTNRFFDDYRIARVSTKKLVAQALKGYSNFFSYKELGISIMGDEFEVLTDEKWSSYILSQIVSNAVKYSPVKGNIIISTVKDERGIVISIINEGKGILEKDLGQVFQKGYTSSENRAGLKATGYGLYLSKKLSDMLGHQLAVRSEYNKYAEFSLLFNENETLHNVTKL